MDINNGEILSLVSLPDFNLNQREIYRTKNLLIVLQKEFTNLVLFLKHLQLLQV